MNFIIKLIISSIAVLIVSYFLPGVTVSNISDALIVAILLSLLNVTLKPLLVILTIPVTILTLGLFLLVINAIVVLVADYFIAGFNVSGFFWAIIFSVLLSIVNAILNGLFKNNK